MNNLKEILLDNPIISAIKSYEDLDEIIKTDIQIVFILFGSITNIHDISKKLQEHNKTVFIHVDMIEGLKPDETGILFLKDTANPYGIICTKQNELKIAQKLGLATILRIFVIDSISITKGIKYCNNFSSNNFAIEVMPGLVYKAITKISKEVKAPIIAGGLIENKSEVISALDAGALAISTTNRKIWCE